MAETADPKSAPESDGASTAAVPTEAPAAPAPKEEEAPDPDEDNLDELDDMLDEFSSTTLSASGPGRPASTAGTSTSKPGAAAKEDPDLGADFSAQLQKEMAALLGEIDESPEMRQQLNELMGELAAGAERAIEEEGGPKREGGGDQSSAKEAPGKPSPPSSAGATAESAGGSSDPAFTDTIRRTLERMAESGQQASAAAQAGAGGGAGSEDDMLAAILKDMAAGAGEDSEEEFSKMLLGMMEQLTNKGILYEPMKELDTKFPEWMEENEGKVAEEDMKRYKEQQGLVKEIVGRFEREGYSDEDPGDREFIVERMQKMQAAGSPPSDLVGDMKGAQEALGGLGPDCPQQ